MPRKDDAPSVATYADHEVIAPPNPLRKVVSQGRPGDDDPIARAEAALATLSSEFNQWMLAECDRLETARQSLKLLGINGKTHQAIFHAAHDIKGEAATFGFPEAAGVAESLCRLLEHTPNITRIPPQLVDQHVDAIRAIAREHARPDVVSVASALTKRLREVTDDFLREANRDRPEYLEHIFESSLGTAGA